MERRSTRFSTCNQKEWFHSPLCSLYIRKDRTLYAQSGDHLGIVFRMKKGSPTCADRG